MCYEFNWGESMKMASKRIMIEGGNLDTWPNHVLVKESQKYISHIESELRWRMKDIL
jgi:hypothetical protein